MFLNITGETCTGTGDTLTLTGAIDGHNAFGKTGNAEDGGLYSCVVADADGVTKVAGAYTFDKTANTLTRNDSWNSTASAVDKNPSSNITLSGGTHTIRCAAFETTLMGISGAAKVAASEKISAHQNIHYGAASVTLTADKQYSIPFLLSESVVCTGLIVKVVTAVAGSATQIGISKLIDGISDTSYLASAAVDTTVTSNANTATFAGVTLSAGWYLVHVVSDSAIALEKGTNDTPWSPVKGIVGADRNSPGQFTFKTGVTGGVLTSDPSLVDSVTYPADVPVIRILT